MDDEFKKHFDELFNRFDGIVQRLDKQDAQRDAIALRLEGVDAGHDRLMSKIDQILGVRVGQLSVLARAGDEAMNPFDALSRRVTKLEAAMHSNGKDV